MHKNKRLVSVADLEFGMYVAELDRPWNGTPFAYQGFQLRTEQQLQALRKYCRNVVVDPTASTASGVKASKVVPLPTAEPAFAIHGTVGYRAETELERELELSSALYPQTFDALERLLAPLEKGGAALDGTEVRELVNELADSVIRNPDAALLLSKTRETRTPAHARALQVSVYMMVFGRFLQREPDDIRLLGLLGLLQDVGKARLPSALFETRGPFTAEATELLKKHVELSAHIVGVTSGLPAKFANLVLLHHERQDGTGYPRALRGYQIGLYGAIAAICDAYDALLAPPPYGEGQTPAEAVKALANERGTAFHGPLLEQFLRCMGAFPIGSVVEVSSGEVGIVVGEHVMQRLKPKVLIRVDSAGKPVLKRKIVDLAAEPDLRVRRTLVQSELPFDPRRLF